MKKILAAIVLFVLHSSFIFAQKKEAFIIYDKAGKKVSYKKLFKVAEKSNIILFGELHNNPISHWLQYELSHDLALKHRLTLGAEMFESKDQKHLNSYLKNEIDAKALDSLAKLWPNHKTDYAPLLNLAKEKNIAFIATNAPRTFANKVYKNGFEALDSLSNEEKSWLAPLPIAYDPELDCYKNIFQMTHGHGNPNLPKAQALKDATMSFFISKNFTKDEIFIHYNGAYHSDNFQSILWYLKKWNTDLQYLTISTKLQSNVSKLDKENIGIADFVICVDENMTKTY